MLAAALFAGFAGAEVPIREVKNVLVILGDDLSLPVVAGIYNALRSHLKAPDPSAVNVYMESLDVTRFGAADYGPKVAQWYRQKYSSVHPDLIVTIGTPALTFILDQRGSVWPDVPVVAGVVTSQQVAGLSLPEDVKPVFVTLSYERTLDVALTLFPRTRRVAVVYGSAQRDADELPQLQKLEHETRNRLEWTYLTGLSTDEFKSRLAGLPDQTVVLWSIVTADSAGRSFMPAFEAVKELAPSSPAPIFGIFPTFLGAGIVGGVMMDPAACGREIAETARSALGLPPSSTFPLVKGGVGPPRFDWRQLQKWGIGKDRLPRGSEILFRPPTLLETHRELVIATSIALLVLTGLVISLWLERRRLAAAQVALKGQAEELRSLSAAMITAQEGERTRIARELHDDINQRLALLAIQSRQLQLREDAASIVPELDELSAAVAGISTDVHSLAHGLHPAKLDLLGLLPAVKRHCREVERRSGIAVEVTAEGLPDGLSRDTSLCLYRIAQESLANVVKHSGAKRASVDLRSVGETLVMTIADDGRGFDPGAASPDHGLGIVGMRERLRMVDGTISIKSRTDAGTEVKATVPLVFAHP
jgi:signal transduction histidine kinase